MPEAFAPDTAAERLRKRLLTLRADLIDRLAKSDMLEPAWLRILADTETALTTLDRIEGRRSELENWTQFARGVGPQSATPVLPPFSPT